MAEIIAIKLAIESLKEYNQNGKDIAIFRDALNAINIFGETCVHKHTNMIHELQQIIDTSQVDSITLVWIPSHVGLEENEQADVLAKQGLNTKTRKLKIMLDLNEMKSKIDEYILEAWQQIYNANDTGKHYKNIETLVTTKIKYKDVNRKKEVTISRLRLGRCKLNATLHTMKKHADGLCTTCGCREDVEHYIMHCKESKIGETVEIECKKMNLNCNIETVLSNVNIIDKFYYLITREL